MSFWSLCWSIQEIVFNGSGDLVPSYPGDAGRPRSHWVRFTMHSSLGRSGGAVSAHVSPTLKTQRKTGPVSTREFFFLLSFCLTSFFRCFAAFLFLTFRNSIFEFGGFRVL